MIELYSKQFSAAECKYPTPEQECLAVLRAVQRFRYYLVLAGALRFVVKSDHKGLASLYKHADSSTRLFRWAQKLANYDYTIEWHSGKSLDAQLPDALSRVITAAMPSLQAHSSTPPSPQSAAPLSSPTPPAMTPTGDPPEPRYARSGVTC